MPYEVKSLIEIINDILIEVVTNIDDVTDVNVGSVLRKLVEALGIELQELYTALQEVYEGTRIETATGTDLDNLGALLGITRKAGTKSQALVTFIRKTPSGSDFTIAQNSIIATQPNTGETQYRFLVKNNTTYSATVTDEEHTFEDGTYNYAMDERFIDSVSQVTGIVSAAPYTFVLNTDYQLVSDFSGIILDPTSITDVDDCDALTGWNDSADAATPTLDSVDYKQGTASINLGKDGTGSDTFYYDKVLGSVVDTSNKNLYLWIKIEDQATLNKLQNAKILMGSGGGIGNHYELEFGQNDLVVGWNLYKINFGDAEIVTVGLPNRSAMNYLRITGQTNAAGDTITLGDMKMDWWLVGTSEDYEGDVIEWLQTGTRPDDGTTFKVSYTPLSKEVLCEAENVGDEYNVTKHKVIYKVSFIANIDSVDNYDDFTGGTDEESDDDLRERIKNATELKGKATAEALRQAVLGVEGVTSCSVNDMPQKTASSEAHTFISFAITPTQALDYEVTQIDGTLQVDGTVSAAPYTFILGTDYLMQDSTVIWTVPGTKPDNGSVFQATYNYRWLGHVEIFVTGTSTPLPSSVQADIDQAIIDTKAAGVVVTWAEPTPVVVNVTTDILVDTAGGYAFASVAEAVEDALITYLNAKEAGDDVYVASLIDIIMEVPGVLNTDVTVPASDVSIASNEVARPGTMTIGSM